MKFDLSAAWNDTIALFNEHKQLLLPLVGVFYFLPEVLSALLITQPDQGEYETFEQVIAGLSETFSENWSLMLVMGLITTVGSLAILWLVTGEKGRSVGDAIKVGLVALIPAFLASLLTSVAMGIGFALLIIPGLYLLGRFSVVATSIVAEDIRNPLTAIGRSWELTKGNGWRITLFLIIVAIVGFVLLLLAELIFGGVLNMVLSGEVATTALAFVSAFFSAIFTTIFVLMAAAIYRQISGHAATSTGGVAS